MKDSEDRPGVKPLRWSPTRNVRSWRAGGWSARRFRFGDAAIWIAALVIAIVGAILPVSQSSAAPAGSVELVRQQAAEQWRGWSEVPGQGRGENTRVVVYRGSEYLFARGPSFDPRVFVNRFDGTTWSGWSAVPGDEQTLHAVTPVVYRDRLHLFLTDSNDRILSNRYDGKRWSGWAEVPGGGVTTGTLAAAVYGGALHLFAVGTDIQVWSTRLHKDSWSGTWSPGPRVNWRDGVRTLAAVVFRSELYLLSSTPLVGSFESMLLYVSRYDGISWTLWSLSDVKYRDALGYGLTAAVFRDAIYVFKHGYYFDDIRFARYDGTAWEGWSGVPAADGFVVWYGGATEYRGRLHIFATGQDYANDRGFILTNSLA